MTAKNQNFEMYAGDTQYIEIGPITDTDGSTTDLTGCTAKWILKKNESDTSIILTKNSDDGGISIPAPLTGVLTINLLPTDTQNLKYGYFHQLIVTDSSNDVSTITTGTIKINP